MKLRMVVFVTVAASSLAGCGGGGDGPVSSAASQGGDHAALDQEQVALMRELSKCYRDHGVPSYPDPVQGPDGTWALVGDVPEPPRAALDACASIAGRIPQEQVRPASAEEMAALRQFAQCMRGQGLSDFPDPEADGSFQVPERLQSKEAIATQRKVCEQFNPGGLKIRSRVS
jgi:hypothetical protein